jgi:hypothetical protein
MAKVAVIGGGIFGVTAAVYTAHAGHEVHLFEKNFALLQAASGINQYRLHRGYHYPRSSETARAALDGEKTFAEEYGKAIMSGGTHLYAIAREQSKVDAAHCFSFFDKHNLPYKEVQVAPDIANRDALEAVVEVEEAWINPPALKQLAEEKLREEDVTIHLNTKVASDDLASFDWIILATYANLNELIPEKSEERQEYKFQVCEKPVIRLPQSFANTGLVIIDGPFTCVDPYGITGLHVLGHVVHAVHAANVGIVPDIPKAIQPLLNKGIIKNPPVTAWKKFVEDGSRYIPALKDAEHIGSMFTVRTVLPNIEQTDARPTVVSVVNDKFIKIFSGKIGTCVDAAREALRILNTN